jgi:hypothetical protein
LFVGSTNTWMDGSHMGCQGSVAARDEVAQVTSQRMLFSLVGEQSPLGVGDERTMGTIQLELSAMALDVFLQAAFQRRAEVTLSAFKPLISVFRK